MPTIGGVIAMSVLGFGRELGREVAARALGVADAPVDSAAPPETWEALARETRALARLAQERDWRPTLVYAPARDDGAAERPTSLAVYEPRQYPPEDALRPVASVNDALDLLFTGAEWHIELEQAKGDLRRLLQTQRDRCQRKAEALGAEMDAQAEASQLRREADTLLAFQAEVTPAAKSATLPDAWADEEGATLTIALDPQFSAVENANRRYARYHKLQRAAELLPEQVEANELELARLEQMLTDLALADTPAEVSLVRAEVAEAGYIKGGAEARRLAKEQRKGGKKGKAGGKGGGKAGAKGGQSKPSSPSGGAPLRRRLSGDVVALVGKNSRQNEEVTFHQAAPNDLWLHARGAPGSHVILKVAGRPAPDDALREAAGLAAWYSQLREAGSVAVDYTEARYVRHMKGGGPGMVIYERERTLHAPPADAGEPVK
jgi:predicted ribosome quality control (RQC) complex YloA/Tae2 family protein